MTELEAVNLMLEAINEPILDSLPTSGTDTLIDRARSILDREKNQILSQGWVFNTILDKTIAPNGSNKIVIPTSPPTLRVELWDRDQWSPAVVRSGNLYDIRNATDDWTAAQRLNLIQEFEIADIPVALARYIAAMAKVSFQRAEKRGQSDDAFARSELAAARADAVREDNEYGGYNMLSTARSQGIIGYRLEYPEVRPD